jgi:5-methylcytosine-specific restriction protein A
MPNLPKTHKPYKRSAKHSGGPRPSPSARGYDARWRKVRRLVLNTEPLCRMCLQNGITEPGSHVDHIIPMARGGAQYDLDNLQPLCASCHSVKTAKEDGGFGR